MKKSTAHWLKTVFSSSSSSSKSNTDDGICGDRRTLKPSSLFSRRRKKNSSRSYREQKQVREFDLKAENDSESETICTRSPARSKSVSSWSPLPAPQPLPVPDLGSLLRRDTKFPSNRSNIDNVRLPSPRELQPGEEKDRQKSEGQNGDVNYAQERLAIRVSERNVECSCNRPSVSSSPQLNGIGRIPNDYRMNYTSSESNSPYSSPLLSPQRCTNALTSQFVIPPSLFQVWSAPVMPSSDSVQYPGPSFQSPGDVTAYGVDNPPIQFRNSNGPASPLSNKLISENQIACRDSNRPLPLPRVGGTPLQHIPIPQLPAKSDLVPIKSRWQKGKLLGRGTFGSVYVASNKETGALCAMKEVEMLHDDPTSAECIRQLEQINVASALRSLEMLAVDIFSSAYKSYDTDWDEIEVLSHLKHANIVQYFGSEIVGDRFHIYLEYVHPGSINNFIRDHCGAITESVVRNFTRHILSGLAYLHSKKTIHRDIKGANLLVDAYGVVKLADFGMAKHLTGQAANLSLKGSPYWMAPELLQSVMQKDDNVELAFAIDIWSLGCTIIEMLNGKPPWSEYEGPAALFKVLKESPPIPENLSDEGKDILRCCFCRNPAERPTAAMLLEHPFVRITYPTDTLSGSLDGMELTEKRNSQRTFLPHKLDQVILLSDMEVTKREIG